MADEDKQTKTTTTTDTTPGQVIETSRAVETTLGPKVETTTRYTPSINRLWESEDPAKTETTTVERKDETTTKVERE